MFCLLSTSRVLTFAIVSQASRHVNLSVSGCQHILKHMRLRTFCSVWMPFHVFCQASGYSSFKTQVSAQVKYCTLRKDFLNTSVPIKSPSCITESCLYFYQTYFTLKFISHPDVVNSPTKYIYIFSCNQVLCHLYTFPCIVGVQKKCAK